MTTLNSIHQSITKFFASVIYNTAYFIDCNAALAIGYSYVMPASPKSNTGHEGRYTESHLIGRVGSYSLKTKNPLFKITKGTHSGYNWEAPKLLVRSYVMFDGKDTVKLREASYGFKALIREMYLFVVISLTYKFMKYRFRVTFI